MLMDQRIMTITTKISYIKSFSIDIPNNTKDTMEIISSLTRM